MQINYGSEFFYLPKVSLSGKFSWKVRIKLNVIML